MIERLATTPFGGARFGAAIFARQNQVSQRQEQLRAGDSGNDTGTADKWQLIRALTEARTVYGLSDRSISLLEALLSFHQDRQLDGKQPIIVFPSNGELSLRCRGMSEATLRRHLAALVDAGMIFRRDSANGKRYCRRDDHGAIEDAFGFDLAPLALKAAEIHAHADALRQQAKRIARLRAGITLHLRDIARTIEAAIEEEREGDWLAYAETLANLSGRITRNATGSDLEYRHGMLLELRAKVEDAYLQSLNEQEMSGNDLTFERHIQNSNTETPLETKSIETNTEKPVISNNAGPPAGIRLDHVLKICPEIADYALQGIKSWAGLVSAAGVVRSVLGISPSAWQSACEAMGKIPAAITVAVLLRRAGEIRSPGGYLRDLTQKAQDGSFSVHPMLRALGTPGAFSAKTGTDFAPGNA